MAAGAGRWNIGTVVGLGTISIELVGVVCAVRCAGPVHGSRPPVPPRAGTPTEGRKVLRVNLPRSDSPFRELIFAALSEIVQAQASLKSYVHTGWRSLFVKPASDLTS